MKQELPNPVFEKEQAKISELVKSSERFRRIYSEYTTMSHDLWQLESTDHSAVSDDLLHSIRLQTSYLEEEIRDWLMDGAVD